MTLTDEQKAALVDPDDGENRAVRYFLMMYGGQTRTIEGMRKHLQLSGFPYWPEWAERDGHLTKGGAQAWIRYLIGLESALSALSAQPSKPAITEARVSDLKQKYTLSSPVVVQDEPDAHNVYLQVGNQRFCVTPMHCESIEETNHMQTMLANALAALLAAEGNKP